MKAWIEPNTCACLGEIVEREREREEREEREKDNHGEAVKRERR